MIIDDEHYALAIEEPLSAPLLDSVDFLRAVLKHECPQNVNATEMPFANGYVQFMRDGKVVSEKQGLLSLTTLQSEADATDRVTREDVAVYVLSTIHQALHDLSTITIEEEHHVEEKKFAECTLKYYRTVLQVLNSMNLSADSRLLTQTLKLFNEEEHGKIEEDLEFVITQLIEKYEDDSMQVVIILQFSLLWLRRNKIAEYVNELALCIHLMKQRPRVYELMHQNLLTLLYMLFGNYYVKSKRYSEAVFAYSECVKVLDCFTPAIVNRATSNIMLGKNREAIGDLSRVIDIDPKNISAYFNRALVYRNTRRLKEAISDFSKVIQLDGSHSVALYYRSQCYSEQGKYSQSIADMNNAISLDPENTSFQDQLQKLLVSHCTSGAEELKSNLVVIH